MGATEAHVEATVPFGPAPAGPYRLIARGPDRPSVRPVRIGDVEIGGGDLVVIAGPCAVETRAQTLAVARAARAAGARLLRGGVFKPRTSPYDFQGLGLAGLDILAEARAATGLPIITEVLDPRDVEAVARVADAFQIGARSMQAFPLLREVGRAGRPVLLKRHWAATLTEWLAAAEYVALEGTLDIVLCERGIRTFAQGDYARATFDLNVVPALRKRTFLPILADPSHATGRAELVPPAARAALAAGADGLLIEIIAEATERASVLCDGSQAIRPHELAEIVAFARSLEPAAAARRESR